jgi:hypothetical protein
MPETFPSRSSSDVRGHDGSLGDIYQMTHENRFIYVTKENNIQNLKQ